MEYTMQDRVQKIIEACLKTEQKDPVKIFREIASADFVRIHGPEHHILDGACVLMAYRNAGGSINLKAALEKLAAEGLKMPGATCGLWGVCGSAPSIGAALAIIDGTGPLSTDSSWGKHMAYTSAVLKRMSEIGGPRCCKRHAFTAISEAIRYMNENYGTDIPAAEIKCGYAARNAQCIGERCPYYPKA